jgi:bacterioferritin
MKGSNPAVMQTLQFAASAEARLNMQYRLDNRWLKFAGVKKTAAKLKEFGDDAHCYMKQVTNRLLFLEGKPTYAPGISETQPTLTATLQNDLALEMAIVTPYEAAVKTAVANSDDTSRNLFEHLLKWHEKHIGWLETQLRLIEGMGEEEYIAEKL